MSWFDYRTALVLDKALFCTKMRLTIAAGLEEWTLYTETCTVRKCLKKRDVEKELTALGYWCAGGTKHDKWINDRGATITVPRHREINEYTAKGILKEAKKGAGK